VTANPKHNTDWPWTLWPRFCLLMTSVPPVNITIGIDQSMIDRSNYDRCCVCDSDIHGDWRGRVGQLYDLSMPEASSLFIILKSPISDRFSTKNHDGLIYMILW